MTRGTGPTDLGIFENCRVLHVGEGGGVESYCLVLSTPKTLGQYTGNFKCSTIFGDYTIHLDGQTIVFAMVMPALAGSPKGTLFYLASIDLLSKHERQVIDEARQQGWNVVVSTVDISFSASQKLKADSGGVLRLANRIDSHLAARAYAVESMTESELLEYARSIHERVITIDTHDDIPFNFATEEVDPADPESDRQVSAARPPPRSSATDW